VTGQYSFILRATNGQLLLTSPYFTDKETVLRTLDLLRSLVQIDQLYRIFNAGGGQCYFDLSNNDGEMLGRSTVYADAQSMQKALTSLKNCAKTSRLLDLTGER
jgi:uncharacterized protein YegP (UPF0339 family)